MSTGFPVGVVAQIVGEVRVFHSKGADRHFCIVSARSAGQDLRLFLTGELAEAAAKLNRGATIFVRGNLSLDRHRDVGGRLRHSLKINVRALQPVDVGQLEGATS